MNKGNVKEILRPYNSSIPPAPYVSLEDKISLAIKKMIDADVRCITVLRNHRPIGIILLSDALERVGLDV